MLFRSLEKGDTIRVPKYDMEIGGKIKINDVLMIVDEGKYSIGQPFVEGAVVEATVTGQGKYDKVIVYKKKRRKDYEVKKGHRQDYTEISVDTIKVSKRKARKAEEKPETTSDEQQAAPAAEASVETTE